ncbi:MAG: preprotein translocase subunit SecE [Hydrogenobaculum sp.]|jgi:preprotein translocase subunit SecE|uniref:preprotein translocase subunit SecE n=1 Tax=unclassified Hydrogenobaculum TaxID=2622382 RepID=UPI00020CD084|nr:MULTISPECIES: preprotein translocase subunit SecE [unclassified Hydrogenobaculum]PMP90875.1 MAG: preprotein translocase subunit SecE [Hydrogenobaculum sp.]AEF18656.1 preprotein translocase, SecE subunit [Hydrogenobaculum sp. 3684]AEG45944.1 preprotein translocase, SecE subunit [Hydrogenobaculum sp. SHO]AGG14587.1 preprotein translocase, SecE subunit [Hydrogenobaculum sp. HO]AGH92886.1 preprotein translocase, SecE subunit [Hydrogenobaculum sp. SN]
MDKILSFLKEVRQELRKVSWPDKKLVIRATVSVIIFSLFFGIYLWIVDLSFTKILSFIFGIWGGSL